MTIEEVIAQHQLLDSESKQIIKAFCKYVKRAKWCFARKNVKAPTIMMFPPSIEAEIVSELHDRETKIIEIPMNMKGKFKHDYKL